MTSKIPSNVEIVLEETAELGHAPAEQPEAQQDEPSSLSPYMQGSEHDSNSGQAWGEPAAQPTFFCSPPRKGRVPPPLDEPGGYHMANMNFRAETDEMRYVVIMHNLAMRFIAFHFNTLPLRPHTV